MGNNRGSSEILACFLHNEYFFKIRNFISLITVTLLLAGVLLMGFCFAEDLLMLTLTWVGFGAIEVFIAIPLQTLA